MGVVYNVMSDHLFVLTLHMTDIKTLWDYLNATYGDSDVGKELFIMKSFHDYKMVANKSVVEQAHEV
jgi:hypothetical protein